MNTQPNHTTDNTPGSQRPSRAVFATRLGVIATTVGSAVGLGNIWRFPYEAGNNGGGAFLLLYIAFIMVLGIPVICAEFAIGRQTRANAFGAFRALQRSGYWHFTGYFGILASLLILSFYSVVAGWTMEYFFQSCRGALNGADTGALHERFLSFSTGWRPVMWTVIFLLINYAIISRDVRKGIERMANVMMPLLFLILLLFCINSLTMPGAADGLAFLFHADFSAIDAGVVFSALGQAFFSLSLGLGCMLTYAGYFNRHTRIVRSACITAGLDTLVAILAGVMIFPAVFTFGVSPTEGPTLVFEVLPNIFSHMAGGTIWSAAFFLMLFLASLTSTISMSEISITFFSEQYSMKRANASRLNTAICLVGGVLCALSFGALEAVPFFDIFNNLSSNFLLPLGGLLTSIFAGWMMDRRLLRSQLTNDGSVRLRLLRPLIFCMKWVAPAGLAVILVFCIISSF